MIARLAIFAAFGAAAVAQTAAGPELRDAVAALQRSDFVDAQRLLRSELVAHPDSPWALSLLGAALDNLNRASEAGPFHQRAAALAPRSADILGNYAAHLWLAGQPEAAAKVYIRIIAVEPDHFQANLQLARLALEQKHPAGALGALGRLRGEHRSSPAVVLLRLEALYLAGDLAHADPLLARLSEAARDDSNLAVSLSLALLRVEQHARAESILEAALQKSPADFTILYNLGLAATRAGHLDRARSVLNAALRQQPRNVDVLYALAFADYSSRQFESAVKLLSQASKLDPSRPDVLRLLATTTTDLGALDDASATWDRYLKLRPDDAAARRERGYTAVQMGHAEQGLADLQWFVSKNPNDPAGHYELGQAERTRDLAKAASEFDRTLAIAPDYVPALAARATLYNQQGQPEKALPDLEKAAALHPDDASALDRLGQTYQALERNVDALVVLRRAAELAPDDSKTLLHLARALADSGATGESKQVMDRFRRLGPGKRAGVTAGFIEYLALTEDQRHAAYRARLDKALREHPDDPALQVDHLKLLLADGHADEAAALAHTVPASAKADAGRAFLAARQYALASELLEKSATAGSDHAIAAHLAAAERDPAAALHAIEKAIAAAPGRPDVYRAAAAILIAQNRPVDAGYVLDRAPEDRESRLQRAVAAELAGDSRTADDALSRLRAQSPEWGALWAAQGVILARRRQFPEAKKALETALDLGVASPEVYYYLALSADNQATAHAAIEQALRLAPADPWIKSAANNKKPPSEAPPFLQRLFR